MSVTAVPIRPLAKGSVLRLWLALIVLCVAGGALAWIGTAPIQRTTTASGLQYQILKAGDGPLVTAEDALRLHLVGRRPNGDVFANTLNGRPEETTPDAFIPGFGEALRLMRKGARYRVWIPPHLGYQGNVPPGAPFQPNETLTFDIEVVDVAPGAAAMLRMQQQMQLQQQLQQMGAGSGAGEGTPGAGSSPGETPPPSEPSSSRRRPGGNSR